MREFSRMWQSQHLLARLTGAWTQIVLHFRKWQRSSTLVLTEQNRNLLDLRSKAEALAAGTSADPQQRPSTGTMLGQG